MNANETRILPLHSLTSAHAIVSMPKTAWFWLDDLVQNEFPVGGYKALLREFNRSESAEGLSQKLRVMARAYGEEQMASLYGLANDNACATTRPAAAPTAGHPFDPDYGTRMPFAYQLFKFLAHPTHLTTVWERRNYHLMD